MEIPPARLEELSKCDICKAFFTFEPKGQQTIVAEQFVTDRFFKHNKGCKILNPHKVREGNGAYSGAWAFTFTKSPTDPYSVGDMLTAVRKVMTQKSQPVAQYAWYYEDKGRDENGDPIHPHIHGMFETIDLSKIQPKHWKRAWPIWDPNKPMGQGFRGGYLRPVRSEERYSDYIKKDGGLSENNLTH